MSSFASPYWNWLIVLVTIGGLFALYLMTYRLSVKPRDEEGPGHVWDEDLTELHNPLPRWWVGLFYLTLAFGVLYLVLYPGLGSQPMFLGWTQERQYEEEMRRAEQRYGPLYERYAATPIPALAEDPDALATGERLFATYCATCHGSDARGAIGFPNLRDTASLYGSSPTAIKTSILDGRRGAMPPWAAVLGSGEALDTLIEHVLNLSGRASDPAAAQAGAARYAELCAACHGPEGGGNQALGAPSLRDDIWLYGGSAAAVRESIAEGRSGRMPAHRDRLGEAKAHVLAAYVYSLPPGSGRPADSSPGRTQ